MRKKILFISILLISLMAIMQKSYAAIEIKPSTAANSDGVMKNSSVSNSYLLCQGMTNQGESLYGATVVPHLSTNADWGAVSYLSNSIYGTNSAGQNTGEKIQINGINYYSTTGNASGVMNWGANCYNGNLYTQTSSLITKYVTDSSTSTATGNVTELQNAAAKHSRFVEVIDTDLFTVKNTLGMGLAEVAEYPWQQWHYAGKDVNYPIAIRQGLFGFGVGNNDYGGTTSGAGSGYATFRPVVWNK